MVGATCCVRLHGLLHVGACCSSFSEKFESGKTFEPTTVGPVTFPLFRDRRRIAQQCWICPHIIGSCYIRL